MGLLGVTHAQENLLDRGDSCSQHSNHARALLHFLCSFVSDHYEKHINNEKKNRKIHHEIHLELGKRFQQQRRRERGSRPAISHKFCMSTRYQAGPYSGSKLGSIGSIFITS